jgi:hypothetical protein
MEPTIDSPEFTAFALGEAPAPARATFQRNLEQYPQAAQEAAVIQSAAARLAAALRQEPSVSLTITQRHALLHPSPASPRPIARRPWLIPTLATTGLAAALTLGLYLFPGTSRPSPPPTKESAIPSVAIQPASPAKPGSTPSALPPSVAPGLHQTVALPEVSPPDSPLPVKPTGTMAATAPHLQIRPPAQQALPPPDPGPAGRPLPHQTAPGESLAAPAPRPR